MVLSGNTLSNYYETAGAMMLHKNWDVEDLIPYEREIYLRMLNNYLSNRENT